MTDERFEFELRSVLREIAGSEAPASLHRRLADVTAQPPSRWLWFSPPLRIATAFVALAAVLALAFLLMPRENIGPLPTTSPTPSESVQSLAPSPSFTPEPSVTPTSAPSSPAVSDWSGLVWSDPVTPASHVQLYDLVPWGDGYVAFGLVDADAGLVGAFLSSPDGLNWSVTQEIDWGWENALGTAWHLVATGDRLLAFSASTRDGASPDGALTPPLVLTSSDGASWSLVDSPTWDAAWQTHVLFEVASGPAGAVAIGNAVTGEHGELFHDPMIMRSTDGVEWIRVELGGATERSVVKDIAAFGNGFAILGGEETGPVTGMGTPQAWVSSDALTWTVAVVEGATPDDNHFERVFAGADGLLARTEIQCAGCVVEDRTWASSDGRTWHRVDDTGGVLPSWIEADGSRMVGIGTEGLPPQPWATPGPYELMSARVSTDGITWSELSLSHEMTDQPEAFWVVPDGVIYVGAQSFWFGTAVSR